MDNHTQVQSKVQSRERAWDLRKLLSSSQPQESASAKMRRGTEKELKVLGCILSPELAQGFARRLTLDVHIVEACCVLCFLFARSGYKKVSTAESDVGSSDPERQPSITSGLKRWPDRVHWCKV